jgi:RNA-directed DNA polymerase
VAVRFRRATRLVVCFQTKADADRFRAEVGERLGKFNLEVEPTKTRVMEFGRFAVERAVREGKTAETFDFLGFTHYCGMSRNGRRFRMKRLTACKKFTAKIHAFKEWLMKSRTMKTAELWDTVRAKLRGHFCYYGVTDNTPGIKRFSYEVGKLLFKWLNRRGKRGCINWEKFSKMLKLFPLPQPSIMVSMFKPLRTTI